ncbi:YbaN family protein [Spiribacter vilamensis]|uniref:YbaN family protein n=1 Tax=Spiribacter vilamensis TaxID=531306 RepID=UPI001A920B2B|nr:YbaN family protein [Spiribacter vilamensis]
MKQEDNRERPAASSLRARLVRRAWLALALFFIGLGSIGVVLPLLPTTPFLLLATMCASRSSPALHAWLYSHPRFGPLLRDWRDHRAIRPRAKITALVLIALSWGWMWISVEPLYARLSATAVLACVVTFLATRPHGPRP